MREESNEKVSEKCCGLASGTTHLQILICGGTGCKASSSQGITENLQKAIERNGITDTVDVITVGCFGFCEKEFAQLASLMADCILRGKEIGPDVARLRAQHLEMGYCFNDAQFETALEKLAEKTGL